MKQLLGIRVDEYSRADALGRALIFLQSGQHRIYTPNPEMLVKADEDSYFKAVLNSGDMNICDGFGLRVFSGVPRIPGVDFMIELCRVAAEGGRSVYLLGSGQDEVVAGAAGELRKRFSTLRIAGFDKGPDIHESQADNFKLLIDEVNNQTAIERINSASSDILFVAFGMGKQEKWIHENLAKMPGVKIAMGVGGAFDYLAGTVPRAPLFLRKLGLEWLYRLIRQPSRLGRIWNATVVFTYLALKEKIYGNKN